VLLKPGVTTLVFTSGLFFKATEDLLGLAWSRLQSTNASSSDSCAVLYILFSAKHHKHC